jgi:GAF domain-containing protein
MSDLAEHKQWLRETTHSLLKRFTKWRRWVKIGLVIGGALVAGAAGVAANFLDPATKWPLYIFQILGLLMVFTGGVVMEFLDEGAADAIRRANELGDAVEDRDNDIASLEGDFEWFTRLYASAAALREVVEGVIISGPGTADDQKRRLAAMLDVLVSDKAVLFGMNSDRWNFAIYMYASTAGNLECVACRRPIRAEEEAPHRSWKPGEGHVGIAFRTQREIVAGDTSEPEAQALFDAPDPLRRDDDRDRYRSIASIPIRLAGEEPIGILVATSDVAKRFRLHEPNEDTARDPVEPLRVLANALALVIRATNLYKQTTRGSNHDPAQN